ncbi:MAG: MarR family winged helix-turn-helix transcriptional regulator [Sphingomicrobium sp.]|nr:MarR family transcriptional regulator [Sphingomonadales bacterium]
MTARRLTLDRFLPYRLSVASNAVSTRISNAYRRRFGLKIPEWRLVTILAESDRITPALLGEKTRMDKITVSRAASALIERGLVATAANPGDGRSHLLSLTDDGRALYAEIVPMALATEAELFKDVTLAERQMLDRLLRRLERAAMGGESV